MATSLFSSPSTTDLVISGNQLAIPERTARLLYISQKTPIVRKGVGISISFEIYEGQILIENLSPDEPSTIFPTLPIQRPADPGLVPRPDYYPTYSGLSPEQKWIYLNWLTNVTQPVDIGYVFIYYYGLERHLLTEEFDLAFDEILLLRSAHEENASFDIYSRSALLNSAVFRKRKDRLEQIYRLADPERFSNVELLMAHQLGYDFGVEGLMRLTPVLRGVQKRYIKSNPDEYKSALSAVLEEQYHSQFFPFGSVYQIADVPKRNHVLYANFSFPSEVRSPALPSFPDYEPFVIEATRILNLAHERVKHVLAKERKKK